MVHVGNGLHQDEACTGENSGRYDFYIYKDSARRALGF